MLSFSRVCASFSALLDFAASTASLPPISLSLSRASLHALSKLFLFRSRPAVQQLVLEQVQQTADRLAECLGLNEQTEADDDAPEPDNATGAAAGGGAGGKQDPLSSIETASIAASSHVR